MFQEPQGKTLWLFIEKLKGNPEADIIDVYEGMDMYLPGMFAFRSILAGGATMEIPNLRNKENRDKWRNDTACTFPDKAEDGYAKKAFKLLSFPYEVGAYECLPKFEWKYNEGQERPVQPTMD